METLGKADIVRSRREDGLIVWDGGLGENHCPAPSKLVELIQKYAHKKEYTSLNGVPGLADYVKYLYSPLPYRILFGNGLKELLFVAQLAFRGTIVHITPSWVSYYKQMSCLGRTSSLVEIHTSFETGWKVTPQQLDDAFSQISGSIMLLFNNPCNPTSVVYSASEVEALAKVCRTYNVVVLADEIYSHLADPFVSMAEYLPCIRGSSISKDISAAGYRLGWLTFPYKHKRFSERCFEFASTIYSCCNTPIQYAFRDFLSEPGLYRQVCQDMRVMYAEKIRIQCQRLSESTKLLFVPTMSAWYIFLNFAPYISGLKKIGVHSSVELCHVLMEEIGLVSVEGDVFRTPTEYCLRVSWVDFHGMENGVTRLIVWLRKIG